MPDWSYRTVFRPLLLRLPFPLARDLCFGFMGGLARLPLGGTVIDFLGHMRPDARLETTVAGLSFPVRLWWVRFWTLGWPRQPHCRDLAWG